ncbi:hypothetical protein FOBRF1_015682 [Fusarium oxysporum]
MRNRQFHLMQRHPLLARKSMEDRNQGSSPARTVSEPRNETGSSITSTSNDSSQSKRKRNESPATTTAPSLNAKYCDITAANMLQMLQNSTPGQGLSWNNPFVSTDIPSFLSMGPTLDAQSLAMSFSSPESASHTVAQDTIDEALPELIKQTSHAATDALDNSTSYSGSQDFDINNLWDLDFSDINSAPLDTLSSTESPTNGHNAVQVKRRARLPSNDLSGYPNFSPSPFTSDSLIMQSSNRYMITESLLQIYHDVLENNLACWLAEENCPYKLQVVARASPAPEPSLGATPGPSRQNPNLPPEWGAAWSNRMYRRVMELDRAAQSARLINLTRSENQAASRVLDLVIMAFTTQWAQGNRRQERFSMGASDFATEADDLADALNQEFEESLQQSVWEQAKRALQDVVDVESYRVIYAELIFGLTQKPWASDEYQQKSFGSKKEKGGRGIKENAMPEIIEIMSQEGPHIYLERATRKIHALKFRFEASESGFMETSKKHSPRRLTEENRRTIGLLYWLAVMFDTVSSSMNERPVALADEDCQHEDADQILADSMRAAQKSRRGSQRWEMELFIQDDATKPTVGTRWPCSYDDAMQMVAKSAPVKILIYRHLSYLQNALRKRECPQAIEEIIQQTTLLYRYWNMTHGAFFRDLIRHYDTVPPRIRSWFFCIAVPWHLGALMLADVLEFIDKNGYGLDQARQKRLSSNVAARIRKASAIELADLAQVTTPRLFQEAGINAAQLPDYHFAVSEGPLLTEPWTVILIRGFTKACLFHLDMADDFQQHEGDLLGHDTVAEEHDDTESLERRQVDICDGQAFQCSASGRPRSLVQTSDQASVTPGRDMGSTNQSLQVNPTGASLPADVQLEAGAALATQSHGSENVTVENDRLSPNVERILLDAIRDGVLFMLGVTTKVAENILITNFGSRTMRFQFGVNIKEIVELSWEAVGETGKRNEDTRIEQALRSAWPKSRENDWERYGLKARERAIPITHYLFEIIRVFEKCMDAWGDALDAIDGLVHVSLDDLDNQAQVEDLMFDKSFDRSKDYFVALQLLRLMDEWIDEVVPSIREMKENPSVERFPLCAAEAMDNFDAAIRNMKERADVVQKRVRKKQVEVNSLRDGLFNATSLREATKAMALNQAIYVFTVVTVLFTPVSFLATFWALPFLNNPIERSGVVPEPSAFRNSFIIMPLLTYVLVIGVAWFVGQHNGTNALLGLLRELWEILGQLMRFAWSVLPRMPIRGNGRSPHFSSDSLEA